jgi:hypothetical protein
MPISLRLLFFKVVLHEFATFRAFNIIFQSITNGVEVKSPLNLIRNNTKTPGLFAAGRLVIEKEHTLIGNPCLLTKSDIRKRKGMNKSHNRIRYRK